MNGDSGRLVCGAGLLIAFPLGSGARSSEVDAAAVLFPVPEPRRVGAVLAPSDLRDARRFRRRGRRLRRRPIRLHERIGAWRIGALRQSRESGVENRPSVTKFATRWQRIALDMNGLELFDGAR